VAVQRLSALDVTGELFFFQAEDGIRDFHVTGVQTCALPISNNIKYIKALEQGSLLFECEDLEPVDALNEYLLTSLRTMWGADLRHIYNLYGKDLLIDKGAVIDDLREQGWLEVKEHALVLTTSGKLLADGLALKLFY